MSRYGPGFRKSDRERKEDANRGDRYYAALAGVEPKAQSVIPPKRRRAPAGASGKPLERNILRRIITALRRHPLVARVVRNQSGMFREGERIITVGYVGKPDLSIYLTNGKWGELEVKRPGGKPNERQQYQLDRTIADGGFAGCATCAAEAIAIIEAA